jgi:tRNA threonylcarbamoyladenosine biosynthesis protein TsaE
MCISHSAAETSDLGRARARQLQRGDVLALTGELGTGKTQFVKGIVAGLGSSDEVTSPTFTLLHEYRGGQLPVYHFDFYRLNSPDEALAIGLDDYLFGDGVAVIEWADRFHGIMPSTAEWIDFKLKSNGARVIDIRVRS